MMIPAGQMRDQVRVEREVDDGAYDEYRNPAAPRWDPYGTFWANIREAPGKEKLAAGRLEGTSVATMRLRATAATRAVTTGDRVVARGAVWAITGGPIDPTGRDTLVEFAIERGGAVQ